MKCNTVFLDVTLSCVLVISFVTQNVGVDVKAQKEVYEPDYLQYHNLTRITADVTELVRNYGDFIIAESKYISKDGHSQLVLRISNFTRQGKESTNQIRVLLSFGEHAREFFPVESLIYFLKNLTAGLDKTSEGSSSNVYSSWILNSFELFIIAMANPDGRDYIEKTKNYCWRGTGSGVDINRNFDWNYGGKGSSKDPHDGEFRGSHAFSEPETEVFRKLAANLAFDAFVSFHSGIRHIYIPYADTISRQQHRRPDNRDHMLKLAQQMSKSCPSRPFKYGLAYELSGYTADGTSFDYMAGVAKIPFSYALEMWECKHHTGRSCFDEFNPRSEHLQREVELVHPLYVELFSYLFKWKQEEALKKSRRNAGFQLVRKKKDDSMQRLPARNDILFISQTSPQNESSASFENYLLYIFFVLALALCVVMAVRHLCHLVRKKRVISLKSLSSTFSLFKSL